jgi:hypothetical protein
MKLLIRIIGKTEGRIFIENPIDDKEIIGIDEFRLLYRTRSNALWRLTMIIPLLRCKISVPWIILERKDIDDWSIYNCFEKGPDCYHY